MVKPSLKTDQYSNFEMDKFSLRFTNKAIENRFKKKKKKFDSEYQRIFLLCLFLSLLLLEIQFAEKNYFPFQSKMISPLFAIFIFFCWICTFFNIYRRFYASFNEIVKILYYFRSKLIIKLDLLCHFVLLFYHKLYRNSKPRKTFLFNSNDNIL